MPKWKMHTWWRLLLYWWSVPILAAMQKRMVCDCWSMLQHQMRLRLHLQQWKLYSELAMHIRQRMRIWEEMSEQILRWCLQRYPMSVWKNLSSRIMCPLQSMRSCLMHYRLTMPERQMHSNLSNLFGRLRLQELLILSPKQMHWQMRFDEVCQWLYLRTRQMCTSMQPSYLPSWLDMFWRVLHNNSRLLQSR